MTTEQFPLGQQTPPPKRPLYKRAWFIVLATLIVMGLAFGACLAAVGGALNEAASPTDATVKRTTPTTVGPSATETTEDAGFPDEGVSEPVPPKAANLTVGETAELSSVDTDETVLRVLVNKAETIRSEPYNKPERGWFLGVHVKVKALADDQTSLWGDFYVLTRGHHYDPDAYAERWSPTLDYVDLNTGETAEGWLVFDVPARHGQVVLKQTDGTGKIATWKF